MSTPDRLLATVITHLGEALPAIVLFASTKVE